MQTLKGVFDIKNDHLLPSLFTQSIVNSAKALHEAMEVRYHFVPTTSINLGRNEIIILIRSCILQGLGTKESVLISVLCQRSEEVRK